MLPNTDWLLDMYQRLAVEKEMEYWRAIQRRERCDNERPLCEAYWLGSRYINECGECPIRLATERNSCKGFPQYAAWINHWRSKKYLSKVFAESGLREQKLEDPPKVVDQKGADIAQTIIRFLEEILENDNEKH